MSRKQKSLRREKRREDEREADSQRRRPQCNWNDSAIDGTTKEQRIAPHTLDGLGRDWSDKLEASTAKMNARGLGKGEGGEKERRRTTE